MVQGRHLTPSISLSLLHDGHLYLIGTGIFFSRVAPGKFILLSVQQT
jgi:hypothetical protein